MTIQTSDLVKNATACTTVLNLIAAQAREGVPDAFPDKDTLHTDISLQVEIIAEQTEKLLFLQPYSMLFGILCHEETIRHGAGEVMACWLF